jgi:23S rRNA (uracil1939-C5)-methyltransferase
MPSRMLKTINNIDNCRFYVGDMKSVFVNAFIAQHGQPDVIKSHVTERRNADDVGTINRNCSSEKIVYVSCKSSLTKRVVCMMDVK